MTLLKPAGISAKPIPFSAPMVRALLDGRKTQTRRVIQPPIERGKFHGFERDGSLLWGAGCFYSKSRPRCLVGDLLWVRESVRAGEDESNFDRQVEYLADGATRRVADCEDNSSEEFGRWWVLNSYRATDPDLDGGKIVSPRHMPRWASRLTLAVTDVRVQRLQEISAEDAIAEGIKDVTREVAPGDPSLRFWKRYRDGGWNGHVDDPIGSYASLWTEIHGPGSWEANPWVVALTFAVHHCNVDAMTPALAALSQATKDDSHER